MAVESWVRWFDDIRLKDVAAVGGKTASLGELRALLGGRVPDGFALTPKPIALRSLQPGSRTSCAGCCRVLTIMTWRCSLSAPPLRVGWFTRRPGIQRLREEIAAAYRALEKKCGRRVAVAVRSSATAEDLPTASFAGQHESFLNVRGAKTM